MIGVWFLLAWAGFAAAFGLVDNYVSKRITRHVDAALEPSNVRVIGFDNGVRVCREADRQAQR